MDPLTHTFFGALLAETGLKRRSALATATLMVGANLPDVDVIAYAWGPDAALGFRRGWTHGVVAMAVLPAVLTVLVLAAERWRRRRGSTDPPSEPRQVLLLSTLAVLSHPLLDWLNTYGVRVLMPLDGTWFYGDALFIVDPWIWLLLGGALFLLHSARRRAQMAWVALAALLTAPVVLGAGPHAWAPWAWFGALAALALTRWRFGQLSPWKSRRLACGVLATAALYAAGMVTLTAWTTGRVEAELADQGIETVGPLMVGPDRIDSLKRLVVVPVTGAYRFGSFHPLRRPAFEIDGDRRLLEAPSFEPGQAAELVERARAASCVHGMVGWMRYPFYRVEPAEPGAENGDAATVYLLDARYTRGRTRGFGASSVELREDDRALCEVGR
ncbi:MAG: metal-dependent hydrolase [Acidobacteriota bacterium]